MKLSFRVLWFDDSVDFLDSFDFELLEEEIEGWGFVPSFVKVNSADKFLLHAPYDKFDLIVVDKNLEADGQGQDFIADVRDNAVFTEVIFYTANPTRELWKAIFENELEGVYVAAREQIHMKIKKVGHQSIQKVLDLENMRGIVMAEVGELDFLLNDIISSGMSQIDAEQQAEIFERFHSNCDKQNVKYTQELSAFIKAPKVIDMLELCDSAKRWAVFNRVRKVHSRLKQQPKLGDYSGDILQPRNFLAHGKPQLLKDDNYRFSYHGKTYDFNLDVSLKLRQNIMKYKDDLQTLKQLVEK